MHEVKDTARALVRISYGGLVHKTFRGHMARERYENEVRVLRYLESKGCTFVPRVIEADDEAMRIVTTNCGRRIDQINPERLAELFKELEGFGVRHDDQNIRNVTYRAIDGRFCLIDFEFAAILEPGYPAPPPPPPPDPVNPPR